MSEVSQFPGRVEGSGGEQKVSQMEIHMPHPHALTPFQKFITVVELLFFVWIFYVVAKMAISNLVYLLRII